jgi:hypothetical protein
MNDSKWPEAAAVMSIASAFVVMFFPYGKIRELPWEAWAAAGTVAAVPMAVGALIWQYSVRKRESQLDVALQDWATANDTMQLIAELRILADSWGENGAIPRLEVVDDLILQLRTSQDRALNGFGRQILSDALDVAVKMRDQANETEQSRYRLVRALATGPQASPRIATLHEYARTWVERVLSRLASLGMSKPHAGS